MIKLSKKLVGVAGPIALGLITVSCSSGTPPMMLEPSSSIVLQGEPITRQAPDNGEISVVDLNTQKLVFSGRVHKDDLITLDRASNRLVIGDEVAAEHLVGGDEFQISFAAGM